MSSGLIEKETLDNIAAAIREKLEEENEYYPSEMANKILSIPTGGPEPEPDYSFFMNYMKAGTNQYFEYDANKLGTIPSYFGNSDTKISRFRLLNNNVDVKSVKYLFNNATNIQSISIENTSPYNQYRLYALNTAMKSTLKQYRSINNSRLATYDYGPANKDNLEYIEIRNETALTLADTLYSLPGLKTLILDVPSITVSGTHVFVDSEVLIFNNANLTTYVRDDYRDGFIDFISSNFSSYITRAKLESVVRPLSECTVEPPMSFDS